MATLNHGSKGFQVTYANGYVQRGKIDKLQEYISKRKWKK